MQILCNSIDYLNLRWMLIRDSKSNGMNSVGFEYATIDRNEWSIYLSFNAFSLACMSLSCFISEPKVNCAK